MEVVTGLILGVVFAASIVLLYLTIRPQKLQSIVDQKDFLIRHLEGENVRLSKDIEQMKERLYKSDIQLSIHERDVSRLQTEMDSLVEQSSQQQSDIRTQCERIMSLEGQLDEHGKQLVGFQECRDSLADYKQRNSKLTEALGRYISRCESQNHVSTEMAAVVALSKLEVDALRERMAVHVKPQWLNDKAAKVCFRCKASFSFTLRRHHCRKCGLVFCDACSSHLMLLPSSQFPERVCEDCHSMLMQRYSAAR